MNETERAEFSVEVLHRVSQDGNYFSVYSAKDSIGVYRSQQEVMTILGGIFPILDRYFRGDEQEGDNVKAFDGTDGKVYYEWENVTSDGWWKTIVTMGNVGDSISKAPRSHEDIIRDLVKIDDRPLLSGTDVAVEALLSSYSPRIIAKKERSIVADFGDNLAMRIENTQPKWQHSFSVRVIVARDTKVRTTSFTDTESFAVFLHREWKREK